MLGESFVDWVKPSGSPQAKINYRRSPVFLGSWSASLSPLCSVVALKRVVGGMAIAQKLQWISEPAAGVFGQLWSQWLEVQSAFLWPPHLGSWVSVLPFSVTVPLPPSFLIHILLIPHVQITCYFLHDLDK